MALKEMVKLAADATDAAVKDLDERIPNGTTKGGEHPTEGQIAALLAANLPADAAIVAAFSAEVLVTMKLKAWEHKGEAVTP
jgi:hypothetical protein